MDLITLYEKGNARVDLLTYANHKEEIERMLCLFEKIAGEKSWLPENELRAYPKNSVWFALYLDNKLAGALHLVLGNSDEGLPCMTVWPELDLRGRDNVGNIALIAFDKKHRGYNLFWLVCVEMWRFCVRRNIVELWVEATTTNIGIYRKLGWPLEIKGELRKHWGEACYPCRMLVSEIEQIALGRARNSLRYKKIIEQSQR